VSAELRLAGYQVREASGPKEAVAIASELMRSRQPDFAIVVDLGMPTTSKKSFQGGFELVQNLAKNGIDAPVLLTAEKLSGSSRDTAKRLGVRKVVFKPSLSKLDPAQYRSDLRTFSTLLVKLLKEIAPAVEKPRVREIDNGRRRDPWAEHVITSMGEQMTDLERALQIANHVLPVAASIASKESELQEDGLDFHPLDPSHIRKHERIGALRIEVKFRRGNDRGEGYLTDLSEKGAFLQTRQLFPVGEFVRLHVILPYQLGEVAAEARIVWLSYEDSNDDPAPHGMGLAFVGPFIN
jgi:Tfp pilus assembly protein PilZ